MSEYKTTIEITERKKVVIKGVNSIVNFDNDYVVLDTVDGRLSVRGNNMSVTDLSKANSTIEIVGSVVGVEFDEKKRGLWG